MFSKEGKLKVFLPKTILFEHTLKLYKDFLGHKVSLIKFQRFENIHYRLHAYNEIKLDIITITKNSIYLNIIQLIFK